MNDLPRHLRKPRLNRREASEYLELEHGIIRAPVTLASLACRGGGPKYQKVNRSPLYPRDELDAWADSILSPPAATTAEQKENRE